MLVVWNSTGQDRLIVGSLSHNIQLYDARHLARPPLSVHLRTCAEEVRSKKIAGFGLIRFYERPDRHDKSREYYVARER